MPRGENLKSARQPLEVRLKLLGIQEALRPDEASVKVRVRARKTATALLESLTPKRRGEVFEAGLKALGVGDGE
ncbi:hypothetical protein [Meiothermus cerbereus]|uniref:hypothetical protein n=1 Tax=Meiothermus cerbereus TaxID=65552 RepID=UPI003EEA5F11